MSDLLIPGITVGDLKGFFSSFFFSNHSGWNKCNPYPFETNPLRSCTILCLHFSGLECGMVIESCAVSLYPNPVLPPTSMKDANLENITFTSD